MTAPKIEVVEHTESPGFHRARTVASTTLAVNAVDGRRECHQCTSTLLMTAVAWHVGHGGTVADLVAVMKELSFDPAEAKRLVEQAHEAAVELMREARAEAEADARAKGPAS